MATPARIPFAVLAAISGITFALLAFPHFEDGLARDAAIPVPIYMIRQVSMPPVAYRNAFKALSRASRADGEAQIAAAEAAIRGGQGGPAEIVRLEHGIEDAPAVPRGWLLLSEMLASSDRRRAAEALSQALVLAPYDFWLAGERARDAAAQWDALDGETRTMALRQVQLLWEQEPLRRYLPPLLSTPAGVALVIRAFASRPDDFRAFNRWLSQERRRAATEERVGR